MIRIGLFLYDTLGGRHSLPKSQGRRFYPDDPVKPELTRGFEYTDCWVDDARLVISNLIALREKGGIAENYTRCEHATVKDGLWQVTLAKHPGDARSERRHLRARCLINATGPWAQSFIETQVSARSPRKIRLIKGSHIIVPRTYAGDQCYLLQNEDKRVVFVIPYLNDFTLIGTTDQEHPGTPETAAITEAEIAYLLAVHNDHFKRALTRDAVVATYSGVRPLCDDQSSDPSAITRDYTIELQHVQNAPLLTVFGGKLTTYRKLAEAALKTLAPVFSPLPAPWTRSDPLPGGERTREETARALAQQCPFVPEQTQQRWVNAYGARYQHIVGNARCWAALGEDFGGGLTEAEVRYLCEEEWAQAVEDILYRRTKLYLTGPNDLAHRLGAYLKNRVFTERNHHADTKSI